MLATAFGVVFCIYGLSLVVYRLYFDPLAGFPGPRIAAATGWYEFYHDVIRRGQYIYKIEEMHKKYGMVKFTFFAFSAKTSWYCSHMQGSEFHSSFLSLETSRSNIPKNNVSEIRRCQLTLLPIMS